MKALVNRVQPRGLLALFAIQFVVSVAIVLLASLGLMGDPPPVWTGLIDVALVFTLLTTIRVLDRVTPGESKVAALRYGYPAAMVLTSGLIAACWFGLTMIDMNVLLPGLAWRVGVLLWALPALIATVIRSAVQERAITGSGA